MMRNKKPAQLLFACLFFISACSTTPTTQSIGEPINTSNKLLVLDSGHTPFAPGALSWINQTEVEYNDNIVRTLTDKLAKTNYRLILTRQPGQAAKIPAMLRQYLATSVSESAWNKQDHLYGRIALANYNKADLFIAIHHDSVQEKYLQNATYSGQKSYTINNDFYRNYKVGYSIYLAKDEGNQNYTKALQFAKILARRLQKLGRTPSTHHSENTKGEAYQAIDTNLGIYDGQRLAILRNATVPAVLVEVGVLLDKADEQLVSSPAFKDAFAQTVVDSVSEFLN